MALLDKSKANYAFKSLLGKSHTSNDRELYNEAIPSGIILSGSRIFGNDINPTPNDVSNAGIVSDLLTLILEPVSGSDTVTVGIHLAYRTKIDSTVPASLIGKINPLTKLEYAPDDYIGNIIPQSFGDSFRPLLFSDTNATIEIPPSSSADWFIDCFAGIVVQESDAPFDLNTNGRVKAYVYIGDFLSATTVAPSQTTTDEYFASLVVTGAIGSTGATVTFATELKQIPLVFINGLKVKVGFDATPSNNLCFFSPDGIEVREQLVEFATGDLLYWNPLFANSFDLGVVDEINLVYNKI